MATTIESIRDKLLLSTDCLSKYRKRADKCRYCEIMWNVGKSCPARELTCRNQFSIQTGLEAEPMDILTLTALANWKEYAAHIGEDALRAYVLADIEEHAPEGRDRIFAAYKFLKG